jgi:hypothetical protein
VAGSIFWLKEMTALEKRNCKKVFGMAFMMWQSNKIERA